MRLRITRHVHGEDRVTPGTKADRSAHVPLGVKVRYGVALVALAIVAVGAGTAINKALQSSQQSHATARQARQNAQLTREVTRLVDRVAADEQRTCQIQARGLPAGHELAQSMRAIHVLLAIRPSTARERAQVAHESPAVRSAVAELDHHLALYLAAERRQPAGRAC